jgi:hypothetical protein
MVLTAPQHSQVAAAYERAARDETLPLQARSAFARKASWFRMLAQISAAKQAGTTIVAKRGTPSAIPSQLSFPDPRFLQDRISQREQRDEGRGHCGEDRPCGDNECRARN